MRLLFVALPLVMAACTPLSLYYKEGASVQSSKDAQTRCEVQAARDVPVRNVTHIRPARHIPAREICDSSGTCTLRPAVLVPPDFITVDANEELRAKAADLCMRQKGYAFVRLPACDHSIAKVTPPRATHALPKLAPNACVIRNRSGTWQIVNP